MKPITLLISAALLLCSGCTRDDGPPPPQAGSAMESPPPTNRIDIPAPVRRNLGITFARVEPRDVSGTLRLPGRFELRPSALREYRAPAGGRIELLVTQYQSVEEGTPLYRLDTPAWRTLQQELEDAQTLALITQARIEALREIVEAHQIHEQGLREAAELWTQRVRQIETVAASGGGRAAELAQAQISLNEARSALGEVLEKHAEFELRAAELKSDAAVAEARMQSARRSAASMLSLTGTGSASPALMAKQTWWRSIEHIEVRAGAAGIVHTLPHPHGAWVDPGAAIASIIDPADLRFRATGLQSDLLRLRDDLPASIVPHRMEGSDIQERIAGSLSLSATANADRRTIDVMADPQTIPHWARDGVWAFLEVALRASSGSELAIPLSCVVRDGLTSVIFRRDPNNPNQVIRIEADLGADDGRWIVVESGVRAGDEIVLDGAFQLMLATSGSTPRGGHFHSDGTFHADDH